MTEQLTFALDPAPVAPQGPPPGAFLGWYDDSAKKPAAVKVQEGIARFVEKYGVPPRVLCCEAAFAPPMMDGLQIIFRKMGGVHVLWLGLDAPGC